MSRKFRYHAEPQEVKRYVEALGYQTEETYNRERTRATGFAIRDTTVQLSYDLAIKQPVTGDLMTVGYGLIDLSDDIFSTGGDADKLQRSRELYEKLYRRFRSR